MVQSAESEIVGGRSASGPTLKFTTGIHHIIVNTKSAGPLISRTGVFPSARTWIEQGFKRLKRGGWQWQTPGMEQQRGGHKCRLCISNQKGNPDKPARFHFPKSSSLARVLVMATLQGAMLKKLLLILHHGFVEARNLSLANGSHQHLFDLADTFELLPQLMHRWDGASLEQVRNVPSYYQQRHSTGYDYLTILDMEDAAFEDLYAPQQARPMALEKTFAPLNQLFLYPCSRS